MLIWQLITNAKNFLNSDEGKKLGKCPTAEIPFIHSLNSAVCTLQISISMGPLTSRLASEEITTAPTTRTTKTTPTTTKVDQPTHLETKAKKVNTPNQVNMEQSRVKDSVVV